MGVHFLLSSTSAIYFKLIDVQRAFKHILHSNFQIESNILLYL